MQVKKQMAGGMTMGVMLTASTSPFCLQEPSFLSTSNLPAALTSCEGMTRSQAVIFRWGLSPGSRAQGLRAQSSRVRGSKGSAQAVFTTWGGGARGARLLAAAASVLTQTCLSAGTSSTRWAAIHTAAPPDMLAGNRFLRHPALLAECTRHA